MSVSVLVCETRPLPVYPIVFWHPGLPVGRKHSVFHFIHRHVRSFMLVSLIWQPACASEHVSEAERRDTPLNIPLCGRALRSVAHGQSKRSANVSLTLTGKPNPAQT